MFVEMSRDLKDDEVLTHKYEGEMENRIIKM